MMDNATVNITSMTKIAGHARRISIITHSVRAVIVTQLVLLLNSLDVVQCQLVNCVNARSELKAEFVINAVLSTGT